MTQARDAVDEALLQAFEAGTLASESFRHADHVRVARAYLCLYALPGAITRFSEGLKRFAIRQGRPEMYHETVTMAYLLLINERLERTGRDTSWEAFAEANPDLLAWRPSILHRYYHPETLDSPLARRTFVMPDRLADSAT